MAGQRRWRAVRQQQYRGGAERRQGSSGARDHGGERDYGGARYRGYGGMRSSTQRPGYGGQSKDEDDRVAAGRSGAATLGPGAQHSFLTFSEQFP